MTPLVSVSAQVDSLEKLIIEATLEYRNHLLFKNENPKAFEDTMEKWEKIEPNPTILSSIFYKTFGYLIAYEPNLKTLKKRSKKISRTSKLPNMISETDLQVIKSNIDLISLMFAGYINPEFPNKVQLDTLNIHEIAFIDIQPDEVIADIGSGLGDHILLLSLIYPNNNFVLNEVTYYHEEHLYNKVLRNYDLFLKNDRTIRVVRGNKKDINLGENVDKIIIRNAFHHFKRKKKMIKSMAEHLNKDGKIIFIEPLKNNNTSIDDCRLKMESHKVLSYIRDSKLVILEEKTINNTLYLSCALKEKK